ncbi:hypothetical protein KKA85_15680 [bacterium]|nr:hypothetical protein [bacterium]MBU1677207.1 hypothetical protein [bacterium]
MAKNHFTFEKRRKELEKKKKKEAKRLARLEKKTRDTEPETAGEPLDEGPSVSEFETEAEAETTE